MVIGLIGILVLVLLLPFTVHRIERNLELFLFLMGCAAAYISGVLQPPLITKALQDPLHITFAVIAAGIVFRWVRGPFESAVLYWSRLLPFRLFLACIIMILGFISSIITAIIAALVLVAIASVLQMDRRSEIRFVILACYAIGMGAVLTPIGEPLSTIATSKLNEDFYYLMNLLGWDIVAGVFAFGLLAVFLIKPSRRSTRDSSGQAAESYGGILVRGMKVYIFVLALTLLGAGFEPLIRLYLLDLHPLTLYWINMISAVLDNATLAAAEISPAMDEATIQAILLGLLISGGMLIPGNIPNIIAAGKLNIRSGEWARTGVPLGLFAMVVYFAILLARQ
ncbi:MULTISPECIES: DUF1646 family protein [unclassified Sporosarcina]|uniref:DUF1646 family protein n=1 Tax=unclassified Sporosarcina TaxID=2647733 RepID=UPI002041A579|nr:MULTISPECIES: DUF1646 family protein [unclassified Sporosarcina]GKV65774.1 hypothetical protein NCCP2331_19270 [Sporosarcina sp. NCCP-2331]GLB55898.1 hypothetical protein NCCP2378_16850 [Sporosarcina sp. NCCP-2378]